MAHLTLELLGYRLMESAGSLLNGTRWVSHFFARRMETGDAVLDAFVVGCVALVMVVIAASHVFLRGSKWLPRVRSLISLGKALRRPPKDNAAPVATDCAWINSFFNWLYFHSDRSPRLVAYTLRRLSEESSRISDSLCIVFDDVLSGSLPPKVLSLQAETCSAEVLVIRALLELTDVGVAVRAVSSDGSAVTGTWSFREAQAEAHLRFSLKDGVLLQASLAIPSVTALGTFSWDANPEFQLPDSAWFDAHVRYLVSSAMLNFRPDYHPVTGTACVDNCTELQLPLSLYSKEPPAAGTDGTTTAQIDRDYVKVSQLRLKLLKATGLTVSQSAEAEHAASWCCTVELDRPSQVRQSATVQMQPNPSWLEEFVFDIDSQSKCLTFTVFDSTKTTVDEQRRRAVLAIDDIVSMRSSKSLDGAPSRFVELHLAGLPATTLEAIGGTLFVEACPLIQPLHPIGPSRPRGSIARDVPTSAATGAANDAAIAESCADLGTPAREEPVVAAKVPLTLEPEGTNEPTGSHDSSAATVGEGSTGDQLLTASYAAAVAAAPNARSDTEILVVSPDVIVDVAKQKLAQRSRQPIIPGSRTTTIIVTSLQKTPVLDTGSVTSAADEATEPSRRSGSVSYSSRSSSTSSCCGSTLPSSEGAARDSRDDVCESACPKSDALSAVISKTNGKSKELDSSLHSPQRMEAKSEQHLTPETPSGANGSFGGTPVSSSSASDVRSKKHKLSFRKFFSFRKKTKPEGSDVSQSTPNKSKKH